MGSVKVETPNQNRGIHEYENYTFTEIRIIEELILKRSRIDASFYLKVFKDMTFNAFKTNGVPDFKELLICIYLDLERIIKQCDFNKVQNQIIKLYMLGYETRDICEKLDKTVDTIDTYFINICKSIKIKNDDNWYTWIRKSGYAPKWKYKICSKCGAEKHKDFFGYDSRNKDRKKSICKICDNLSKKE